MSTGPVGIRPITFSVEDFKDPNSFHLFNEWVDQVNIAINTFFGLHGPVPVYNELNMQGNAIRNLPSTTTQDGDAVSSAAASASFGASAVQSQLEATGSQMLQTVRRLNDQNQREKYSSFLNEIINVPPVTNNSTVNVVNNGNGTTTVTVSADNFSMADRTVISYAQRSDTFTNPGAGSNTYYYYLRKSDNTLQFIGPFASATPFNAFGAFIDGRGLVAKATVNAGGGGSGSGGGSVVQGGCLLAGTPIQVPPGKQFRFFLEECDDWIVVHLKDGRKIQAARGTMTAVFKAVEDLKEHDFVKGIDGSLNPVDRVEESHEKGQKMHASVEGGVYGGDGIEFHNFKPNG